MSRSINVKGVILAALLVLMINLPVLHSTWTQSKVERSGVDVVATVTDHRVLSPNDPEYFLVFHFDEEVDPDQTSWTAEVDRATYDDAVASSRLDVRVLKDQPSAYQVEGEVTHHLALITTLFADAILLIMGLLFLRFRANLRPQLVLRAVEDVTRCPPGPVLDKAGGGLHVVCGEVSAIEGDEIVLDLGDRSVRILLDGHHNPVGYQQAARVTGRMVG